MHKIFLILATCFLNLCTYSQVSYPYQDIKLEKPRDYVDTEPMAVSAANFLLSTPFKEVDTERANALTFLSNWMTGTKAYSFYMAGVAIDISDDKNLLSLYLAAMAKHTLENKAQSQTPLQIEAAAIKTVLAYCDDPKNNFKLKKKYRKILEKN